MRNFAFLILLSVLYSPALVGQNSREYVQGDLTRPLDEMPSEEWLTPNFQVSNLKVPDPTTPIGQCIMDALEKAKMLVQQGGAGELDSRVMGDINKAIEKFRERFTSTGEPGSGDECSGFGGVLTTCNSPDPFVQDRPAPETAANERGASEPSDPGGAGGYRDSFTSESDNYIILPSDWFDENSEGECRWMYDKGTTNPDLVSEEFSCDALAAVILHEFFHACIPLNLDDQPDEPDVKMYHPRETRANSLRCWFCMNNYCHYKIFWYHKWLLENHFSAGASTRRKVCRYLMNLEQLICQNDVDPDTGDDLPDCTDKIEEAWKDPANFAGNND